MSGYANAMAAFNSPSAAADRALARRILLDLLDADGNVRFMSVVSFHDHLRREFGLTLVQNSTHFVRPGGRHLFYRQGCLLLRVKTSGTFFRPRAHMTLSLAVGLGWNEEIGKFNRSGQLVPKLGAVRRADWRSQRRVGHTLDELEAVDDDWANACHFNFASGFDGSGAAGLR